MELRHKQRFSFIIKVFFWGMLHNLWNIFYATGKFIMVEIRIVKDEKYFEGPWSALFMEMLWWGCALCFIAILTSSVLQSSWWILTTECLGSSHREPARLWVCPSTWILFLGFNPRYNYTLLIQVGSQGYHH